jgi:hypothetical protein
MGKKALADIANTMPHMVAGRIYLDDWEALALVPDGMLTIDLLARTAYHTSHGALSLRVVMDLAGWLEDHLAAARLLPSDLAKAELAIVIRTDRVPVDRSRIIPFDMVCTGIFATNDRAYNSKPVPVLRWYTRGKTVSD